MCVSLGTLICVSQASDGFQVIIFLPSILLRVLVVSAHIRNLETFSDLVREAPIVVFVMRCSLLMCQNMWW